MVWMDASETSIDFEDLTKTLRHKGIVIGIGEDYIREKKCRLALPMQIDRTAIDTLLDTVAQALNK